MEPPLIRTLTDHRHEVCSVAFSPTGLLATGGGCRDNSVRLWDPQTWKPVHRLRGHKKKVNALALSPDGRTLASVSHDKTVRVWDTETGELRASFGGHKGIISSAAFSPDGTILATADHGGRLFLRDAATTGVIRELEGHTGYIISVAFSADGRTLASAGGMERQIAEVRLWEVETGRLKKVLGGHSDWVLWTAFSPDNKLIGSGSYGEILLIAVESGVVVRQIRKTDWSMVAFAFSPDGRFIATGAWRFPRGGDGTPDYSEAIGGVQRWEAATGQLLTSFNAHERQVTAISYSPDGEMLASGSTDGTAKIWDVATR
jgi:WD40 repeat protein